ncbi:hypothetical protein [Bradyrhizobium sp. SZCCHNS1054]|uniref:phenylacetate--CoA ligase family protein n=1 Tax=Bradyrhizobium sp. SZCCHNS1054 TaxID=3057301 RepID=UPI002916C303|nr:hypothetical protein [Bradyrhizobium sp. SZCCHNS1054]
MMDVRAFDCGISAIRTFTYSRHQSIPETEIGQRRILSKWNRLRNSLHERTARSPEEIAGFQFDRLSLLVDMAYITHPFYHKLYKSVGFNPGDLVTWENYHALPSISKEDIVEAWDEFGASRCMSRADCYSARTSGSSGKALNILQDGGTNDFGTLFYLRHYEQMLGRKRVANEWLYEIYLAPPRFTSFDGAFPVFTISNQCPPDLAAAHIARLKPKILSAFPSYLTRMVSSIADLSGLGIEAICTNSESSIDAERDRIAEAFGAPVFDEYSSEELYLIATQCREGRYHLIEDNVRVDVLTPDRAGRGEIVATSLTNTFMPFIRYRQGDVIQIASESEPCACGSRFRHLASFHGRADQFLVSRTRGTIQPDRVMTLYTHTLFPKDGQIAEFQVVQDELGSVDLLLVPERPDGVYNEGRVEAFVTGLKEIFADEKLDVRVRVVAAMPASLSHKRRLVTNRIGRS